DRTDRLQYALHFLQEIKEELQIEQLQFTESAKQLIESYQWPGNIRQLKSALREAAFLTTDGFVDASYFPAYIETSIKQITTSDSLLQDVENKAIIDTLTKTNGNISEAARILGIGRNTLYRKIDRIRDATSFDLVLTIYKLYYSKKQFNTFHEALND